MEGISTTLQDLGANVLPDPAKRPWGLHSHIRSRVKFEFGDARMSGCISVSVNMLADHGIRYSSSKTVMGYLMILHSQQTVYLTF